MAANSLSTIPAQVLQVYSREAILEAQPLFVYRNFVEYKEQLGIEPGKTITFLKLANLTGGGLLASEFDPIFKEAVQESTVSITVYEAGGATQVTRAALEASFRDTMSDYAVLLGRRYAEFLDGYLRDVFSGTANEQFTSTATAVNQISDAMVFTTAEVKDAIETLKTLNAPMFNRGGDQHYVCIAHPHQLRSLRDDQDWKDAHQYVNPENIYNGEVGRYENCIFIETTQQRIDVNAGLGGTVDVYHALFLGARSVGFAETVPMEIVTDGVESFGRLISLGWYTIMGGGIINDYLVECFTA